MSGVDWFQKRGNVSQMVSAAFAVVSAIIAAVGFCLVLQQLKDSRSKTAAEAYRAELADARKIYASYSESILRYPHLSKPDYEMLMHNRNEYLRYQAFVAHMVNAYDDILNVVERSTEKDAKKEWLVAFDVDIKPHRRYLCHPADPRFAEMYRSEMQRLLRAAAGDCKDKAPLVEVQALRPTPISE